jgi:hypothetical protein
MAKERSTAQRKTGEDSFGRFVITGGPCSNCGHALNHCVKYAPRSFELPEDILVSKTILKTVDNYIGVNCGCYGKFHRQVAHIVTLITIRKQKKS